ncbi:MAG: ATP-grasp domain-containing protein [Janthinobacterium lividum]
MNTTTTGTAAQDAPAVATAGTGQAQCDFLGLAPLMRQAFAKQDLQPYASGLIERISKLPDDAHALMNLANTLLLSGSRELALAAQGEALALQQLYDIPATGIERLRLLVFMAAGDLMANTPLEFLLENSDVALTLLYVGAGIPAPEVLPEHHAVFIAIGQSDDNHELLLELAQVMADWPRPVINAPERIAALARDKACALLRDVETIAMPMSARIPRDCVRLLGQDQMALTSLLEDGEFPIIVRPVGSHAGHGLEKISTPAEVSAYLDTVAGEEFFLSRFIDYRSADGLFRKFRIMLIDGQPFICHMAISSHWMIHYLNAGMAESEEKRAEEGRFMASFAEDFVPRHAAAFAAITERLELDYVGIDCAETPDGKLLIFEADSDMIVHAMDPVDMYPYKPAPMQKLFGAFRAMLVKRVNAAIARESEGA